MLNEKQIEALKNGAYGVTRDGRKALYAGTDSDDDHVWLLFMYSNSNMPEDFEVGYNNFHNYQLDDMNKLDIVGLWEDWKDKPEPFSLERALAGEPVRLVNEKKAYVLKQLTNKYGDWLLGYIDYGTYQVICDWGVTGGVDLATHEKDFSIDGMWKEPEPVKLSADNLPKPIKDFGDLKEVWRIKFSHALNKYTPRKHENNSVRWSEYDYLTLANGCYFATEEDAQANCDWLMNRGRYE